MCWSEAKPHTAAEVKNNFYLWPNVTTFSKGHDMKLHLDVVGT